MKRVILPRRAVLLSFLANATRWEYLRCECRLTNRMKINIKILLGAAAPVAVFCASALVWSADEGDRAPTAGATNVTWLGPIVVGVGSSDVVGGPFPRADKDIEIGLRGDGVVVWHKAGKGK
jgi:hypothetical protein